MVIAIIITLAGTMALLNIPVAQYPDITPPTIQVSASYPGADAQTLADTVAAPIEQQVNGVEGMIYMSSTTELERPLHADGDLRDRHRAPTSPRSTCRTAWRWPRRSCPMR